LDSGGGVIPFVPGERADTSSKRDFFFRGLKRMVGGREVHSVTEKGFGGRYPVGGLGEET